MLSGLHFYHKTTRKVVVAFGNLFNNIRMVRYNNEGTVEIERIVVPLAYSTKEKYYKRIIEDPNLENKTQTVLPRMAFDMTGLTYDLLRKMSNHNDYFYQKTSVKRTKLAPYNFDMNLYLFVRNHEDGFQIIEQILPYFTPDYTITVDLMGEDGLNLDMPVVFNSVSYEQESDGDPQNTRVLIWTLNFTVKGYIAGPERETPLISNTSYGATGNVYSNYGTYRILKFSEGNGVNYQFNELVYQGGQVEESNAVGYVRGWDNLTNTITISDARGNFTANSVLTGAISGAKYILDTIPDPRQIAQISVLPDPPNVNVDELFATNTVTTLF